MKILRILKCKSQLSVKVKGQHFIFCNYQNNYNLFGEQPKSIFIDVKEKFENNAYVYH